MRIVFCAISLASLASCCQPDRETAALTKYYAQLGDKMTTALERAPQNNPKPGQTSQLNSTNSPPLF